MQAVLVHEWLTNMAGSEKVVAALRGAFQLKSAEEIAQEPSPQVEMRSVV